MGGNQDQDSKWEATSSSPVGSPSKQSLSREEFMAIMRQASNAPCPSRAKMISQHPGLENERNVASTLDTVQKALADDKVLVKKGDAMIKEFRNALEQYGFGKMPLLSPKDVTEVGRMSTQIDKRCIETRIGRTS